MHFDGLDGLECAPLLDYPQEHCCNQSTTREEPQIVKDNFQMDGSSIFLIRISKNHDFFKFTNFGKPKKNDTKLEISCS